MNLAELQAGFQSYLLSDVPDKAASTPFVSSMVNDQAVGIQKRLNIYHHAYRARMEEALGTAYPNLHKWLGCQAFNQTVQAYITKYPSTFRNLRWVGGTLSGYLAETMPAQPFAADLAAFEWALSLAFDAQDVTVLSVQDLSTIPPEEWNNFRFSWHQAVQLKTANTQVIAAWQALDADKTPDVALQPTEYVIWRQDMMSYFKTLDQRESSAINLMMNGGSFGELCEALTLTESDDQAVSIAAGYLSEWLNAGMLQQVKG